VSRRTVRTRRRSPGTFRRASSSAFRSDCRWRG